MRVEQDDEIVPILTKVGREKELLQIKEEIENIIEELKNDVTAKGSEIEENKKIHEEGLAELN